MKRIADAILSLKEEHLGVVQPLFVQILDDLIKANPDKGYEHLRTLEAIPDMVNKRVKYVKENPRNSARNVVHGLFGNRRARPRQPGIDDGPLGAA